MPHPSRRLLLVAFLGLPLAAACSRTDAADRSPAASASTGAAARTDGGTLATAVPHDSINDRADRGRIAGDSTAKVWLIEASDFQCPFCKQWHDAAFTEIRKDYVSTGRVRLAFLNMPLSIHPHAVPAAETAMCASVQNRFWELHESLFATQDRWAPLPDPTPVFDSLVAATGANTAAYRDCMTKHLTRPMIQADHDRAKLWGAGSTPTFIIIPGNTVLIGADANVRGALDAALAATGAKKPGA